MPEFIAKLRYKTYEKGEYSDEKVRGLDDTLLLIRNFPWEEQRGSDVQLTGPSVTIQDEYGNFLKAGLYFNDKFCLYYLDCDNHLYEYHASGLEDVCSIVSTFFEGKIDLAKFEKHLFNVGNIGHFLTNDFIYRVKAWRVVLTSIFIIFYFAMFLIFAIALASKTAPFYIFGIPLLFALAFGGLLVYIFKCYLKCSNQVLQVSKGNNIFSFENSEGENTYNKDDIKEIIVYGRSKTPDFVLFEIRFKNDSVIKFSTMPISDNAFRTKFSGELFIYSKKLSLWRL